MWQHTSLSRGQTPTSVSSQNESPSQDQLVERFDCSQTLTYHGPGFDSQTNLHDAFDFHLSMDVGDGYSGKLNNMRFRTPSLRNQHVSEKSSSSTGYPTTIAPDYGSKHENEEYTVVTQVSQSEHSKQDLGEAVGFWHPALTTTRKDVFIRYWQTLLILCAAIMAILSIYWGVLIDVKNHLHRVSVAVVSFEEQSPYQTYTPAVGPFVQRAIEAEIAAHRDHLGFQFYTAADFDHNPDNVRLAVFNQEHWAAVIVHANATALLIQAVESGNASYDPSGAAMMVYEQARDIESYNFYVIPVLNRLALSITASFATFWAGEVLSNAAYDSTIYGRAPQAVSPGISFTMLDLRPFDPPSAIPTISIGLIYLIIIAFFSFTFFVPTHMKFVTQEKDKPHPPLKFHQLVVYRWCATLTAYVFLSLAYSLVSLAFLIPFNNQPASQHPELDQNDWDPKLPALNANPFGDATFLVYWVLNFVGMAALGLPCENMAMLLSAFSPLPYSALFLIWWVITNVSTGFYAIEIASDFYRWGYAWPLRQIVEGSKTLVFGTKNQLGMNFGILFGWVLVSTILFPVACWVMRWNAMRQRARTMT